jgi:Rps23 Pro-64 3,4-dihydroxylase Tpa1-like proline 4-hydroxylase
MQSLLYFLSVIILSLNSIHSLSYTYPNVLSENLLQNNDFQLFCKGEIPFACITNAFSHSFISELRQDALNLRSAGVGAPSGVITKTNDIRHGVHQIWLQAPETPKLSVFVGRLDARQKLYRAIDALRQTLANSHDTRLNLEPSLVELSYLLYDPGSYYKRHIDTVIFQRNQRTYERCVSILLYLGDSTTLDWDCAIDGGALRVYESASYHLTNKETSYIDITPNPGTLVLFESDTISHEVRITHRSRQVVIGWFGKTTEEQL